MHHTEILKTLQSAVRRLAFCKTLESLTASALEKTEDFFQSI